MMGRCKLKFEAELESSRLVFEFEELNPGTFNTG
jgi:hypothetical protein